jgi:hypothetical protein
MTEGTLTAILTATPLNVSEQPRTNREHKCLISPTRRTVVNGTEHMAGCSTPPDQAPPVSTWQMVCPATMSGGVLQRSKNARSWTDAPNTMLTFPQDGQHAPVAHVLDTSSISARTLPHSFSGA